MKILYLLIETDDAGGVVDVEPIYHLEAAATRYRARVSSAHPNTRRVRLVAVAVKPERLSTLRETDT